MRSRSWVTAFLGGMAAYHVIVLPAIFVLGPVLAQDEMNGARSWAIITAGFGVGCVLGVWAIAGLEVLARICVTGTFTLRETSLQEHILDRALSRVSSCDYLTTAGLIPVGNLVVGLVSSTVGVRASLHAVTAVGATAAVLVASVPGVRRLPRSSAVS